MLQVLLSTPETQTHEWTEINAMKAWSNLKHENSDSFQLCFIRCLAVAPLGHRAAHLSHKPIFEHSLPDEWKDAGHTP